MEMLLLPSMHVHTNTLLAFSSSCNVLLMCC
jgi:hypothetical protein